MGKITGRSDDMLIIRGVNVFPTQIEELVLGDPRFCGNYQLVVTREGHLDELEVRCELRPELTGQVTPEQRATAARELQHRIKTMIGVSTRVTVMDFDSIPRTVVGKAKRVIDERKKQ
jgi:phenylacetate-CoA ligase